MNALSPSLLKSNVLRRIAADSSFEATQLSAFVKSHEAADDTESVAWATELAAQHRAAAKLCREELTKRNEPLV